MKTISTHKSAYLWWVKSPEAYSNRRNSLKLEPKLNKHTRMTRSIFYEHSVQSCYVQIKSVCKVHTQPNRVPTVDCETGGVCSDPADLSNGPQTTSCWARCWRDTQWRKQGIRKEFIAWRCKHVCGLLYALYVCIDGCDPACYLQSLMTWWMSNSKAASRMLSSGSGTLLESRNIVMHDCSTHTRTHSKSQECCSSECECWMVPQQFL